MKKTSSPRFNLLDEPWIPVRPTHGEPCEINLTELLLNARAYASIEEASPPNLVAIYRLLLAILHRALTTHHGPWKNADRIRWFQEGIPEAPMRAYLEQWRDRFWVFHHTHPFMQVAALAEADETRDKTKPWTQLRLEAASGAAPTLFDHTLDDDPASVPIPMALRAMLGYMQFIPGGLIKCIRGSDNSGPLVNTAAVLPIGRNLTETLLLGLHPYDAMRENDRPAWEQSATTIAQLQADATLASGPNDRYTRKSRAVLFLPETDDRTVRHIRFAAGIALKEDPNALDPMACHKVKEDGEPYRISFTEGRATWRDLPSIIPDPSGAKARPASILGWAIGLTESISEEDSLAHVLVAGLANTPGKVKFLRWRNESHFLPRRILAVPGLADEIRSQIGFTEEVFRRVKGFATDLLVAGLPSPTHKDTKSRARDMFGNTPAESVFFSSAERALPCLMNQIAEGNLDTAHQQWRLALADAAEAAWQSVHRCLGDSPEWLRAGARTYPKFKAYVNSLLLAPVTASMEAQS